MDTDLKTINSWQKLCKRCHPVRKWERFTHSKSSTGQRKSWWRPSTTENLTKIMAENSVVTFWVDTRSYEEILWKKNQELASLHLGVSTAHIVKYVHSTFFLNFKAYYLKLSLTFLKSRCLSCRLDLQYEFDSVRIVLNTSKQMHCLNVCDLSRRNKMQFSTTSCLCSIKIELLKNTRPLKTFYLILVY